MESRSKHFQMLKQFFFFFFFKEEEEKRKTNKLLMLVVLYYLPISKLPWNNQLEQGCNKS